MFDILVTIEFYQVVDCVLLTHEHLLNAEQRDKHEHGWNGCINQLTKFI